jgi:hypothetical protein
MAATPKTYTFRTLNNKVDPASIAADQMTVAENIDLDGVGGFSRRKGRTSVALMSSPHSLWSSEDDAVAFYGYDSTLKRFWSDETSTDLLSLSTDDKISFVQVNNVIVFSNGTDIGYVKDGEAELMPTPTEQFKIAMAAGVFIAFYNGRLYALGHDGLYYSDPYTITQMDERNCIIPLLGAPTMLIALKDGLWVGKDDKVIWLSGGNPEEFTYTEYSDSVVPGTAVVNSSTKRLGLKIEGKFAVWTSDSGICVGANGGAYQIITEDYLAVKKAESGTGFIREANGLVHYITSLQDTSATHNQYTPASITVDSQTTGG